MSEKELHQPRDVSFQPDSGFLAVKIDADTYGYDRRAVLIRERRLETKDELHITILSREAAEQTANYISRDPQGNPRVQELINQAQWGFRMLDRFYHVREEQAETVIQIVEMPGLQDFFRKLSELIGQRISIPPVHVTLYMAGTEKGIGLPDQQVFEDLVQGQVDLAELERAE